MYALAFLVTRAMGISMDGHLSMFTTYDYVKNEDGERHPGVGKDETRTSRTVSRQYPASEVIGHARHVAFVRR